MAIDQQTGKSELAMSKTDPDDFRKLVEFWHPPHINTTAYEVYMEQPYANGHLFLRTRNGRIACYDLRRP